MQLYTRFARLYVCMCAKFADTSKICTYRDIRSHQHTQSTCFDPQPTQKTQLMSGEKKDEDKNVDDDTSKSA